jgi:hypothetical protein
MSSKVGGPGEPGKEPSAMQQQTRKVEKIEKIRSVDETENERTRKKFQSYMGEDEDESSEKPRTPTPFETSFYSPQDSSMIQPPPSIEDVLDESVVASPSYSPQPNVNEVPEPEENEAPPLPRSQKFWHNVDSSPDHSKNESVLKEVSNKHELNTQKAKEKERLEKEKKEALITPLIEKEKEKKDSIFGFPGKVIPVTKEKISEKQKVETASPFVHEPLKKMEKDRFHQKEKKEKHDDFFLPSKDVQIPEEKHSHREDKHESGNKSGKPLEIEASSKSTIPANIIPIAQAATTQVSSYLSPQTMPLFFQMVGTIYVMSGRPGVSTTDIVLNSPSFAASKFFGATISIEKYATAPDSFNIRITGSNEAVKTFNDNLTNLYSAFQNGNFNFRIGRISAEYSIDRPVFRRRERDEGSSDTGDGDSSDRRRK